MKCGYTSKKYLWKSPNLLDATTCLWPQMGCQNIVLFYTSEDDDEQTRHTVVVFVMVE
jgi:hypothetical protein